MTREPFLLVQLSDPHIGATWADRDPAAALAAAVEQVAALDPAPAAVLVTGDIAEHAADAEYDLARELLAPLGPTLHVLPGNHDDRDALCRHFGLPEGAGAPVQYTADLGPLRLLALDSTRPGEDGGELDAERLEWLDAQLASAPDVPALIATHHSPFATGIPALDAIGLPAGDRRALGAVVERHPQVLRIVAGHVHRPVMAQLGGRAVLAAPSTYLQLRLDFRSEAIVPADEPGGFALHAFSGGELVSHVVPVTADRTR